MKVARAGENGGSSAWLVWLAMAALAWFLFRPLSLEWGINPQYSYGWVVPALTAYLIWERWRDRPVPSAPKNWRVPFWGLLILLGAIRLAQEANPDWRLLSWMAGLAVVGILWCGLRSSGGKAWGKHFGFAVAFVLVAIPWPTPVENLLVQSLMRGVAGVAVEFLNWLGIAAQQDGNLVRLATGTLGIDEACSGVRSFQATIMAALFLGELRRLTWPRRSGLVLAGVGLALGLNLLRAILLAVVAGKSGTGAVERWHDPAGYVLLALTFFGLLGIARLLGGKRSEPPATGSDEGLETRSASLDRWAVGLLVWLVLCEVGTQFWYRSHERGQTAALKWRVEWPYGEGNFVRAPIAESIRLILRFNKGKAARWDRADGSRWVLYFFDWKPGRAAASLARNHRPDICMPATGFKMAENRGVKIHKIGGLELPIERLEFKHGTESWHVYYCLWEDRIGQTAAGGLLTREARLQAVIEGRRHLGQRVLEVVITGLDAQRADREFAEALSKWIIVDKP